jgi:hypothetical protein
MIKNTQKNKFFTTSQFKFDFYYKYEDSSKFQSINYRFEKEI